MTEKKSAQKHYRARSLLPLPQGLVPAPGALNMRLGPGDIFTVDDDAATRFGRFLANRVRAGDLEEVDEAAAVTHRMRLEKETADAAAKAEADAKAQADAESAKSTTTPTKKPRGDQ